MRRFGDNPDPRNEAYERKLSEQIYWERKAEHLEELVKLKIPIGKSRKRKKIPDSRIRKYKLLIKKTNEQGLNPEAVFMYVSEKRSLLREVMGYTQLKGKEGRISLDECSESQIGKSFRNNYKTAFRAISS